MNELEKKALAVFMYAVLNTLYPNFTEYPFDEIERVYETYGDESEEFAKFPEYQVRAFLMKRSIEVIRGERRFI